MNINDITMCPECYKPISLQNVSETTFGSVYRGSCDKCGITIEKNGMNTRYYKRQIDDISSNGYLTYSGEIQNY
jgi:hypothetical protein